MRWRRRMRIFGIELDNVLMIYWYVLLLFLSMPPRTCGDPPNPTPREALMSMTAYSTTRPAHDYRRPLALAQVSVKSAQSTDMGGVDVIKSGVSQSDVPTALDANAMTGSAVLIVLIPSEFSSKPTTAQITSCRLILIHNPSRISSASSR